MLGTKQIIGCVENNSMGKKLGNIFMSDPIVTLNFIKAQVRELVKIKGFPNDKSALSQKLLWAFVELGEASDAYKKGKPWDKISEEIIDVIFYLLDFIGLAEQEYGIKIDADKVFLDKLIKNFNRPNQYGQNRDLNEKNDTI